MPPRISTLFIDIGNVLLTDSWGPAMRRKAVEVAQSLGINSIHHTSYEATRAALDTLGLSLRLS